MWSEQALSIPVTVIPPFWMTWWFRLLLALGVIMAAVYILFMFQRMFLGPEGSIVAEVQKHGHTLRDMNWREIATFSNSR